MTIDPMMTGDEKILQDKFAAVYGAVRRAEELFDTDPEFDRQYALESLIAEVKAALEADPEG